MDHASPTRQHEVGPVMSSRWKDFADIAVQRMAGVKPGEKLLVLADTETDQEVAQACLSPRKTPPPRPRG